MSILPLRAQGASVRRRGKTIIGPIDFSLAGQGLTVVMGPNGAGKTTFLRMLHGLMRPRHGTVQWNRPLAEARLRQAFVFQTPVMLRRTVGENIALPLLLRHQSKSKARAQATDWAGRVGLGEMLKQQATDLSGGEKQKLALARALITEPELLFLDEPTANLDGRSMREIEAILTRAQGDGTRIIMATHNIGQAQRLASDVVFLYRGKVHEQNRAQAFFSAPQTPEAAGFVKGDIVE